ncbi:Transcriptional regulator, TetR family [Alloactinosynnema sp. L-07]|uniref:TetR/AcrR family transcriptional regulator n=1 Tax=Alloactinosynnema sp. L-07 TaxID=1653480 RepID=UPI00065F0544|nr:TetR/AcrR family transcriptional regulator [Alloactinosynnema sp. L-07]CRK56492.1 Transcriptional regulator, TetR family [Alloactinosynnema sp. L-07]
MPLPRFLRLPPDRQAAILAVARAQFAEQGPDAASYNKIIEAAGISKTAAYHYFDGKGDLLDTVLDDVRARLLGALGAWREVDTAEEFWAALRAGSARLVAHLEDHPHDLALATSALSRPEDPQAVDWVAAVVSNGQRVRVIRTDVAAELLVRATAAVLRELDGWALAGHPAGAAEWSLLAGLWGPR